MIAGLPLGLRWRGRARWVVYGTFLISTALSVLLVERSQIGGDQLNLLARGWLFASEGHLIPYGNPGSGGGVAPGATTSLAVGLPLLVWRDVRAPIALILVTHLLAFLLLDRLIERCLGDRGRVLFAVVYGLSPGRLYFSGVLWNPSFLFLAGALHAWTAFRQQRDSRFGDSFLHALTLLLSVQLHLSTVMLGISSVILYFRRAMKLNPWGVLCGSLLGALPLIPFLDLLRTHSDLFPAGKGFLGRGLMLLYPLAHGILNWFRHTSLALSAEVTRYDFSTTLGVVVDRYLSSVLRTFAVILGAVTVLAAIAAARWWLNRQRRRGGVLRVERDEGPREWLDRYALVCFIGAMTTYCLAPTTPMWWQGVSVFHAAVIPTVRWGVSHLRTRRRNRAYRALWAWGAGGVVLTLLTALGSQQYRCGGRHNVVLDLAHDHPMIEDLRLRERCEFAVATGDGWWPDVLTVLPGGMKPEEMPDAGRAN